MCSTEKRYSFHPILHSPLELPPPPQCQCKSLAQVLYLYHIQLKIQRLRWYLYTRHFMWSKLTSSTVNISL